MLLLLASRGANVWLLLVCAVSGSLIGGYTSWRIGHKGGQVALRHYIPERWLKPINGWMEHNALLAVAVLPLLPPPIPLAPFVLASGALGMKRRHFLAAFGIARTVRYGLVIWFGAAYGRHVVRLWLATIHQWSTPILWTFAAIVVIAAGTTLWQIRMRKKARVERNQLTEAELSHAD
jgi:membrane protein YqaA with SNARE-associated domain